jgi:uncharacterized protein YkwD
VVVDEARGPHEGVIDRGREKGYDRSPWENPAPRRREGDGQGAWEQQVIELVNQQRKANGRPPLKHVASLTDAARWYAKDMVDDENIADDSSSPPATVTGWMGSSGHRANILNGNHWETGVGYRAGASHGHHWVQDFGRGAGSIPS